MAERAPASLVQRSCHGVRRARARAAFALLIGIVPPSGPVLAQPPSSAELEKLRAETAVDHAAMLARLGIHGLRAGPSGDESKPDHANYDETLANPYPVLPDPLRLESGAKVTTADDWWRLRQPEIVADFEREVVGRVPANVPGVSWATIATREWTSGGRKVVGFEQRMTDAVGALKERFKTLRTGRANLGMLDGILVSAYGADVPINQVANLSVPEPTLIVATP